MIKCLLLFLFILALSIPLFGAQTALTNKRPVVAVVLSGGAALGFAHIGVLKILEEVGIPVDIVVGTSMGSIVGGLYVAGYSPREMATIAVNIDWKETFSDHTDSGADNYERMKRNRYQIKLPFGSEGIGAGPGLLEGQRLITLFEKLNLQVLDVTNFDDFSVRYRAVATDILDGKAVVLDGGSIADAMRASMSIPALFKPYQLNGKSLVDGGVINNMPVDVAKAMGADIIIAVEVKMPLVRDPSRLRTIFDVAGQTEFLFIQQNVERMRPMADLVITPDLTGISATEFDRAEELIRRGEKGAAVHLQDLRALAAQIKQKRALVDPEDQANRAMRNKIPPVIKNIRVEGGTKEDEQYVMARASNIIGQVVTPDSIDKTIQNVYTLGKYDLVRFSMEDTGSNEVTGIFKLTPDSKPDNFILAGLSYHGSISSIDTSDLGLLVGATIENLTGKESALFVETAFINMHRLYLEYFQPVFGSFFIIPFLRYLNDYDETIVNESVHMSLLYRTIGGGLWAGTLLGKSSEIKLGYSYESVRNVPPPLNEATNEILSVAHALFTLDTRKTTFFPKSGFYDIIHLERSDYAIGSSVNFWKVSIDSGTYLPFSDSFTIGVHTSLGTDFSGILGGVAPLNSYRGLSLKNPYLFTGYESWSVVGSHKIAAGMDGIFLITPLSKLLGGDLLYLVNFSVGNVIPAYGTDKDLFPLRWNATTGLGLRITPYFGLAIRFSIMDRNQYAVNFDLGSFTTPLEDER